MGARNGASVALTRSVRATLAGAPGTCLTSFDLNKMRKPSPLYLSPLSIPMFFTISLSKHHLFLRAETRYELRLFVKHEIDRNTFGSNDAPLRPHRSL